MKRWLASAMLCFFGVTAAACSADVAGEEYLGEEAESLSCANPDGYYSVMAALAVATGKELGRWQATTDFYIDSNWRLALTATGKSQCADKTCKNVQALLDLQKPAADGTIIGTVRLNSAVLQANLFSYFDRQKTCDTRPDNGKLDNCPAETHKLTLSSSAPGSCDMDYWFLAKKTTGAALTKPAQLANKLLFAGYPDNQFLQFRSVGEKVGIDPTGGLNEGGTTTSGACSAVCTRISSTSLAGKCCSCNGVNTTFKRSAWSATTFQCKL
jgi:hypothetical protein